MIYDSIQVDKCDLLNFCSLGLHVMLYVVLVSSEKKYVLQNLILKNYFR